MNPFGTLRRKLSRARQWSLSDWAVVAESWWELLRADIAVSARPYASWQDRVSVAPEVSPPESGGAQVDPRVVELFRAAARNHVRPMNCLRRAIALRAILLRRGYDPSVRFGVRRVDGRLDAHAWLTVDGVAVDTGDTAREDYAELHAVEQGVIR